MPQLDLNYFFSSFTWLIFFFLLFYCYLLLYIIPKIFKVFFLRKLLNKYYTNLILEEKLINKSNQIKINKLLVKIFNLR